MNLSVRRFRPGDAAALAQIFFLAVHQGAAGHYTAAQRRAWAPAPPATPAWADKLSRGHTLVAERDGMLAGFMCATDEGYVDLAFTHPDHLRQGVASTLLTDHETRARALGLERLTTHASRAARPFFAAHGWQVDAPERVDRRGEMLERFAMSKPIVTA